MTVWATVNVPLELSLRVAGSDAGEREVDVTFAGPEGRSWQVPAFWSGDDLFRVRFAPPVPGRYSWKLVGSDDNAVSGVFEAMAYEGANALYRHGRLRVGPARRTLEHSDGTPFLWLGDTWWMGLSPRLPWPDGFRELTADRVEKGFNLVQIVVGPLPDFPVTPEGTWHPQQANEGGWPWEPDFARINPYFYDAADLRIAHLVANGLGGFGEIPSGGRRSYE